MNIGALLFGVAMLVVAIPFVLNPFLQEQRRMSANPPKKTRESKDKQTGVLTALRDLEFDYQTGKVTEEDYQSLRSRLMVAAAAFIEQEKQAEARLESQIQERRNATSVYGKCPKCGGNLRPLDHYCPKCGEKTNLQSQEKKCPD
jgi:hypothetical protein